MSPSDRRPAAPLPYEYVNRRYGVHAYPGERVKFLEGEPRFGTIARRRAYDHHVWVTFDGEQHPSPCHPTSLEYGPADDPALATKTREAGHG